MVEQNTKVYCQPLRSKKNFRKLADKEIVRAGFEDDEMQIFSIEFDIGNGTHRNLLIIWDDRFPELHISQPYPVG